MIEKFLSALVSLVISAFILPLFVIVAVGHFCHYHFKIALLLFIAAVSYFVCGG